MMAGQIRRYLKLFAIWTRWFFDLLFRNRASDSFSCLVGRTAIVTGGNAGIGYAVSTLLASRGCKVIIADIQDAEESKNRIISATGNKDVSWKHLDLASLSSVREFAEEVRKNEGRVDILINNAGLGLSKTKVTSDKLNKVMQVNFFGHFLLTHLLIDCLKESPDPRVLFASSIQAYHSTLTPANLEEKLNPVEFDVEDVFNSWGLYCDSKLCNIFAAQEFGERLRRYGILVNSADPGAVSTHLFVNGDDFDVWYMKLVRVLRIYKVILFFVGEDNFGGAQTIFHLATSKRIKIVTGQNYFRCRQFVKPEILQDPEFCNKLWSMTEKIVNLNPEERLSTKTK